MSLPDDAPGVHPLRPAVKCGIVFAGLALALVAACAAMLVRQRFTPGPDAIASSGMHAFGDLLVGIAVFCVVGAAPLALTLYWLRPVSGFWRTSAWSAVGLSATGPVWLALAAMLPPDSLWSVAAPLRVLAMPVLGALWFTTGTFSPQKLERWLLWGATAIEFVGFVTAVLVKIVLPLAR